MQIEAVRYDDGNLHGQLAANYAQELGVVLSTLRQRVDSPEAQLIAGGRNRSIAVTLEGQSGEIEVLVKCFGRQSLRNDLRDSKRGSKAERSFHAARHLQAHGVGTPEPIGYLERWDGARLVESYYLSRYMGQSTGFGDHLLTLYHSVREVEGFVESLRKIAVGARRMHDSGFMHNDLGNQNILLNQKSGEFNLIDLNRGSIRGELSLKERAKDLSRLAIPSGLQESFLTMYWDGRAPKALTRWLRWYRKLYDWHANSRKWRHPIREARIRREQEDWPAEKKYPEPTDIWIWDSRTNQAYGGLDRRDRLSRYPRSRYWPMIKETLRSARSITREFNAISSRAFPSGIALGARIGVSIEPHPDTFARKLELLDTLGSVPVLIRLYHHTDYADLAFRKKAIQELQHHGHTVGVSLVQDRRAVLEPDSWRQFVNEAVEGLSSLDLVEVAHAINRVKWGIWCFDELEQLYEPIRELSQRRSDLKFTGPAGIDFEYPFVVTALRRWPRDVPLAALSHHLYVDRRGAPENPQNGFGALEKFAMGKAIGRQSGLTDNLIVTGVNWPLANAGPYSPIAPPHVRDTDDVGGVDEDTYASYMVRYLLLALTSGHVERVYWWHLVSRGFGLVDDTDADNWRLRPAWFALKHLVQLLEEGTTVTAAIPESEDKTGLYQFEWLMASGERVRVCYAHGEGLPTPAIEYKSCFDQCGHAVEHPDELDGRPVFFRGVTVGLPVRQH